MNLNLSPNLILMAVIGLDLYIASSSRLGARIRACALQGLMLAALPLCLGPLPHEGEKLFRMGLAALFTFVFKALLVPVFLHRAVRQTGIRREVQPFVSLHLSLLLCAGLVGLSFWLASSMDAFPQAISPLGIPTGLATLLIGLYLTVRGRQELTQVIGYLVLENGVFVIGQMVLGEFPLVVELGVLLDVIVAVMLMAVLFVFVRKEDGHPSEHEALSAGHLSAGERS